MKKKHIFTKSLSGLLLSTFLFTGLVSTPVLADELDIDVKSGFFETEEGMTYYEDGIRSHESGLIKIEDEWYYLENGIVGSNDVVQNSYGWWYVDSTGKVNRTFNGLASNSYGTWYCQNGQVDFSANGVFKDDNSGNWVNIVNGKLTAGPTIAKNSLGWWYIDENGYVDFTYDGLAKNANGWFYLENGKVNFSYTGLAANSLGTWYCQSGKVNFSANGVLKDQASAKWANIVNGKVTAGPTVAKNNYGWWYIDETGYVNFSANTIAKNSAGWWKVSNGKVNFTYTGIATRVDNDTSWYCENGKVNFSKNGLLKDPISGKWANIVNGKVTAGPTIAKNSSGWWYIDRNGYVDFNYSGSVRYNSMMWIVINGKVKF